MTQQGSFLRHALVFGIGSLLMQGASFILLPLYTHYLTPADFGVLEILNRTGDILVVCLMANGLTGAAFTFYCQAETTRDKARMAATVNLLAWLGSAAGCVLAISLSTKISGILGVDDPRLTAFGLCASISQFLPAIQMVILQARLESVAFIVASLATLLLRVTLVVLFVSWGGWGLWGVLAGALIASVIAGCALACREYSKTGFRPDPGKFAPLLRFAWPFVPGGLCGFVLQSSDRFFLLYQQGPDQVGIYSIGAKVAAAVGMLAFAPLFKVWSSWMYRVYQGAEGSRVVGQCFTRLLAPFVFTGLAVWLFRREVILLLGTSAYTDATKIIGPLVVAQGCLCSQVLMDGAFYVYRHSALKLGITMFATAILLALLAILVPRYGAMGAAMGELGAMILYAAATRAVSQRVFAVTYEWGRVLGMVALACVLAAAGGFLSHDVGSTLGRFGLLSVWPVVLWTAGLVTQDEKEHVARLAQRALRAAACNREPS